MSDLSPSNKYMLEGGGSGDIAVMEDIYVAKLIEHPIASGRTIYVDEYNIYTSTPNLDKIVKYDMFGNIVWTYTIPEGAQNKISICGDDLYIYVGIGNSAKIVKINKITKLIATSIVAAGIDPSLSMAVNSTHIYFSSSITSFSRVSKDGGTPTNFVSVSPIQIIGADDTDVFALYSGNILQKTNINLKTSLKLVTLNLFVTAAFFNNSFYIVVTNNALLLRSILQLDLNGIVVSNNNINCTLTPISVNSKGVYGYDTYTTQTLMMAEKLKQIVGYKEEE